uniref:Uncharacterized protein n=1 Tax=Arundo donax TaxID=35708 RepID=A0A0A9C0C8_ARUDO
MCKVKSVPLYQCELKATPN